MTQLCGVCCYRNSDDFGTSCGACGFQDLYPDYNLPIFYYLITAGRISYLFQEPRVQIPQMFGYRRGSLYFWWRCDTLATSGFADDVLFAHNWRGKVNASIGPLLTSQVSVAEWLARLTAV